MGAWGGDVQAFGRFFGCGGGGEGALPVRDWGALAGEGMVVRESSRGAYDDRSICSGDDD